MDGGMGWMGKKEVDGMDEMGDRMGDGMGRMNRRAYIYPVRGE